MVEKLTYQDKEALSTYFKEPKYNYKIREVLCKLLEGQEVPERRTHKEVRNWVSTNSFSSGDPFPSKVEFFQEVTRVLAVVPDNATSLEMDDAEDLGFNVLIELNVEELRAQDSCQKRWQEALILVPEARALVDARRKDRKEARRAELLAELAELED